MSRNLQLILASGSAGRKAMLKNAGLKFEVIPADIDENTMTQTLLAQKETAKKITSELAAAKALHISKKNLGALVIGSDQTLVLEGEIFSKAKNKTEALAKLRTLSRKTHSLNSAVCVAQNEKILWQNIDSAYLTMHDLDEKILNAYADSDKEALTSCVGAYRIEGQGAWLFSDIKGDVFTIMGMPLLPLLTYLRTEHGITP